LHCRNPAINDLTRIRALTNFAAQFACFLILPRNLREDHTTGNKMADLLTIENLGNLLMLCFLQAVLGFDNLLYISIESQRAPVAKQASVRRWGIIIAVALRVVLLFVMIRLDWRDHRWRKLCHPRVHYRRYFHHVHGGQRNRPHADHS
jgi:hypothetical protein